MSTPTTRRALEMSMVAPPFGRTAATASPAAAKPDGNTPPAHIPNVATLRKVMMSFGRTPPPARPALLKSIRAAAAALGATNLEWVQSFLKTNGTPAAMAGKPSS
jgi:hypothetical protein